ncbi:MAG: 4-hydroxy-tetrahydrodipicolinate reductase [Omnitrophica bacterium RIFCSPLOWO2_01_FULL_45_10]|nr:MAG: 4-hydroxy-tetrahydrodipicolinate reductase [Omnitrophica bacterium RIFCSPLOWO2_01_FULL_45_10]
MIKLCVSGSKGKMGLRIAALAKEDNEFELTGQFDIGEEPASLIEKCDCLIEFTSPEATIEHLAICEKYKKAMVIGTTGLSDAQKHKIGEASKTAPIVFSPNMSVAVNLLFKIAADCAKTLGEEYNVEILEAHHVNKVDAPSGTAKELGRVIKEARGGIDVPIESIREDEIVGEHTVTFDSPFDLLEITHSAKTRDIFAKGALQAAKFVVKKDKGLFTMKDVLSI